jgi:hypothetical protein
MLTPNRDRKPMGTFIERTEFSFLLILGYPAPGIVTVGRQIKGLRGASTAEQSAAKRANEQHRGSSPATVAIHRSTGIHLVHSGPKTD